MQPPTPHPSSSPNGPTHSGPPVDSEVHYTAPQFQHDVSAGEQPTHHPDYEFIMNPATAAPRKINLKLGGGSSMSRLALILGSLLVLMIIFVIGKSLLGGGHSNSAALITVAQDQQALIRITKATVQQQGTSVVTQNSSSTILASMTSSQQQLVGYMKNNGQKLSLSQLNLGVHASVTTELEAAAAAGTYDTTYKSVVQAALTSYQQALKQAYAQTSGPKGRALLTEEFKGAQLLTKQLGS